MARFAELPSWQDKLNTRDVYDSFDEICRSDLDALVIITQPWLHAPQCVQAMESGKHVYSAVPVIMLPDGDEILEWCNRLVTTCRRTGMHYMLGETTYYHPEGMFCRRKAAEDAFGDFILAEGEYMHDLDGMCSLRDVFALRFASRSGQEGRRMYQRYRRRGVLDGPMHYPTHSTSGPVFIMNSHALKVTAYGYRNANNDPFFEGDAFSNETALFTMSNGATVQICEFRECGGTFHDTETFRIIGTRGSYAENVWKDNGRTAPLTARPLEITRLTDAEMRDPLPPEVIEVFKPICDPGADVESDFVPSGHKGSHPYLVHEFVEAVAQGRHPSINIWEAVRYMAMGVAAHKSALRDGERLDVPDWGNAPST